MLDKYPIVYVEWEDHQADGGWSEETALDDVLWSCHSIGWLARDTDTYVVLIGCHADGSLVGNKQYISKKLIKNLKVIRKGKTPKASVSVPPVVK